MMTTKMMTMIIMMMIMMMMMTIFVVCYDCFTIDDVGSFQFFGACVVLGFWPTPLIIASILRPRNLSLAAGVDRNRRGSIYLDVVLA